MDTSHRPQSHPQRQPYVILSDNYITVIRTVDILFTCASVLFKQHTLFHSRKETRTTKRGVSATDYRPSPRSESTTPLWTFSLLFILSLLTATSNQRHERHGKIAYQGAWRLEQLHLLTSSHWGSLWRERPHLRIPLRDGSIRLGLRKFCSSTEAGERHYFQCPWR